MGDWMTGEGPLYRRLAAALQRAITTGDLLPGERLPSERELARMLAVSRSTVVTAYDRLRGDALLDSVRGSGTRVADRARAARPDGRVAGGTATSIIQRLVDEPGEIITLAFAVEPAVDGLAELLLEVVGQELPALTADIGYHPRGLPAMREAVAGHLTGLGLSTDSDQVLVTTGATQAMVLTSQLYVHRGARVVVESPSWPGCLDVFRAAGARLIGVPLDDEGIEPEHLRRALGEHTPALLYVTPTFHNPTGVLMSARRRRRIAELAEGHQVPILEDNAYATRLDDREIPPPVAAFARAAEVLSVGSLSKAVWGGLRIGWVRAPYEIIERLARLKALADLGSPILDQALAARLLPRLSELTAARVPALRQRLDRLTALLATRLPDWRWRVPDGGSALWIALPDIDARVFAQVALRHGVEVVPGANMDPSGAHDGFIRVPYTFDTDTLTELVRRLRAAWTDLQRHGAASDAV